MNWVKSEQLIHALKTSVACLIGLFLNYSLPHLTGIQTSGWIVISIIVVMCAQLYVGSVVSRSYLRFLGTLVGTLFAITALYFFSQNKPISIIVTIAISTYIFSYFATRGENWAYAGTLGAVTTAIILLNPNPTVSIALERMFEICLGILIATIVSQFLLPIQARTQLLLTQAQTFIELKKHYLLSTALSGLEKEKILEDPSDDSIIQSEHIIKLLGQQRQLIKVSFREFLVEHDPQKVSMTLQYERDLLRSIDFVHHALKNAPTISPHILLSNAMRIFNEAFTNDLTILSQSLSSKNKKELTLSIPVLNDIRDELKEVTSTLSSEEWEFIQGFLFSTKMIGFTIKKLADLHNIKVV